MDRIAAAYHFVGDGGWRVGDAREKAEDFDVDGEVFADYVTTANQFEMSGAGDQI
jgi:hypothetical protein